jgi:hypothetical protein
VKPAEPTARPALHGSRGGRYAGKWALVVLSSLEHLRVHGPVLRRARRLFVDVDDLEPPGAGHPLDIGPLALGGLAVAAHTVIQGGAGSHVPTTIGTVTDQRRLCRNRPPERATGRPVSWGCRSRSSPPERDRIRHGARRADYRPINRSMFRPQRSRSASSGARTSHGENLERGNLRWPTRFVGLPWDRGAGCGFRSGSSSQALPCHRHRLRRGWRRLPRDRVARHGRAIAHAGT